MVDPFKCIRRFSGVSRCVLVLVDPIQCVECYSQKQRTDRIRLLFGLRSKEHPSWHSSFRATTNNFLLQKLSVVPRFAQRRRSSTCVCRFFKTSKSKRLNWADRLQFSSMHWLGNQCGAGSLNAVVCHTTCDQRESLLQWALIAKTLAHPTNERRQGSIRF